MRKGQSLILEFIMFFMISFSLFAVISAFFFSQNEFFKGRIGDRVADIINNMASTHMVNSMGCKSCLSIDVQENIPSKIGGYYYEVYLSDIGLNTTLLSEKIYSRKNPLFILNNTLDFVESKSVSENKILEIQINSTEKEAMVK